MRVVDFLLMHFFISACVALLAMAMMNAPVPAWGAMSTAVAEEASDKPVELSPWVPSRLSDYFFSGDIKFRFANTKHILIIKREEDAHHFSMQNDAGETVLSLRLSTDKHGVRLAHLATADITPLIALGVFGKLPSYIPRAFRQQPTALQLSVREQDDGFQYDDIFLESQGNTLTGHLAWHRPSSTSRAHLSGRLHINRYELGRRDTKEKSTRFFSTQNLHWEVPRQNDLSMEINIDSLLLRDTEFKYVQSTVHARAGTFIIKPLSGTLLGHPVHGELHARLAEEPPLVDFQMATLSTHGRRNFAQPTEQGAVNMDVHVAGRGNSVADIVENGDGTFYLDITDAHVPIGALHLFGADILTQLADALVPRARKKKRTNLKCAVLWFDFEDGLTTSPGKIMIRTNRVSLAGEGNVNLKDESLNIAMQTKANTGLGISATVVTGTYKLGGTLNQLKITGAPVNVLKSVANLGIAVATGGYSLLVRGLFDRVRSTQNQCKELMEERVTQQRVVLR